MFMFPLHQHHVLSSKLMNSELAVLSDSFRIPINLADLADFLLFSDFQTECLPVEPCSRLAGLNILECSI